MMAFAAMYGGMIDVCGIGGPYRTRTSTLDNSLKIKSIPAGCQRFKFESDRGDFETDALTEKRAIDKFNKWYEKQTPKP